MPAFNTRCLSRLGICLALALLALAHPVKAQGVNFTLPDLDNRPVQLADFRGRWVIVNFWASWCAPCLLEMPDLQAFHEAHYARAVVIGVNFEEITAREIRPFLARLGVTFPVALSGGQPVPGFEIKGLPTTFFISPAGQRVGAHLGAVNTALLTQRLTELEQSGRSAR
ncbi:MAG: TlpA family protein disulfide reductase [Candidatus Competibacter sp.]|nr:TlpA family protein disulfide reductase [Candidatus Competibacter sp.]MDG4605756.1 TlpA disulfide reductase family protein [Candidatus Contendobacter sp.]HRD50403.1 TlpA disulfide reductase family protein [Candidatus Contendobacter sp.]